MSWTYDATLLDSSTDDGRKYIVRLMIGDTQTLEQQLQDEEIEYLLDTYSDSVQSSSIAAVRLLIAKYAREADAWMGHTRIERSQRVRQYRQLLDEMLSDWTNLTVRIWAGGQSLAEKAELDGDTDAVQPRFKSNMDDITTIDDLVND